MHNGTLSVTLVRGTKLAVKDANGKSDPYVYIWTGRKSENPDLIKSATIKKTLNPEWNETYLIQDVKSDVLKLRVWDYDSIGGDDFMGKLNIDLGRYFDMPYVAEELELPLLKSSKRKSKVKGTLTVKIEFQENVWSAGSSLCLPRVGFTYESTAGLHLIIGGSSGENALGDCERLDVDKLTWSRGFVMSKPRTHHASVTMPDGRIIVSGGNIAQLRQPTPTSSCEVFDPNAFGWSEFPPLMEARFRHTINALPGGRLIAIGGFNGTRAIDTAEIYDPVEGEWSERIPLPESIMGHKTATLSNGDILVVGGATSHLPDNVTEAVYVYSNESNSFYELEPLSNPNLQHSLLTLPNNDIAIFPGTDWYDESLPNKNQKTYNNVNRVLDGQQTFEKMGRVPACSTVISINDSIIAFGGRSKSEVVSKAAFYTIPPGGEIKFFAQTWKSFPAPPTIRCNHTAIHIPEKQVILLIAGVTASNTPTNQVEILNLASCLHLLSNE